MFCPTVPQPAHVQLPVPIRRAMQVAGPEDRPADPDADGHQSRGHGDHHAAGVRPRLRVPQGSVLEPDRLQESHSQGHDDSD